MKIKVVFIYSFSSPLIIFISNIKAFSINLPNSPVTLKADILGTTVKTQVIKRAVHFRWSFVAPVGRFVTAYPVPFECSLDTSVVVC